MLGSGNGISPPHFTPGVEELLVLISRGSEKLSKEGRGAGQTFHPSCSFIRDLFGRSAWSISCAVKDVHPTPPKIPLGGVDEVFHPQEWLRRLLWIPKACMEMDKPAVQAAPLQQGGFPEKDPPFFLGKGLELMEPLKFLLL